MTSQIEGNFERVQRAEITANPSKMIPRAITNVTLRILFIYIVPVFCLVLIFPWYKANVDHIVFADALNYYGLTWAGAIAGFVTLTAAISCANSGLYGIVRAMNALAREGMAPRKHKPKILKSEFWH